jgi:hypothetical protein
MAEAIFGKYLYHHIQIISSQYFQISSGRYLDLRLIRPKTYN